MLYPNLAKHRRAIDEKNRQTLRNWHYLKLKYFALRQTPQVSTGIREANAIEHSILIPTLESYGSSWPTYLQKKKDNQND